MAQVLNSDGGGEAQVIEIDDASPSEPELLKAIDREFAIRMAAGKLVDGRHVHIDDGSRANLVGMATVGMAVLAGTPGITWPEDYARGWVTIEGDRLPLATPADGIALAYACGNYYAALVQHQRDLEGDLIANGTVDPTAGWPAP